MKFLGKQFFLFKYLDLLGYCHVSSCVKSADTVKVCKLFSVMFQGPYVYELFSIMIHSGSAAGGHYYAYIK